MINLLSTVSELLEQRQALIEAYAQSGKFDRTAVDELTRQLSAIDRVLKIALDTESRIN